MSFKGSKNDMDADSLYGLFQHGKLFVAAQLNWFRLPLQLSDECSGKWKFLALDVAMKMACASNFPRSNNFEHMFFALTFD